jgi:HK97 gp10 family phage protein
MAKGFNISADKLNISKAIKKLQEAHDELLYEIDAEMMTASVDIVQEAKQNLSNASVIVNNKDYRGVDTGNLRNKVTQKKSETAEYTYEIVAQTNYAAYIEFGTGPYAASYVPSLEDEWQDIARQFKGKRGAGQGVPARPFMYPAVQKIEPELLQRLKQIIEG